MEAAITWLVQTILATLLIDKLDAWIRQVELVDDIEKLKSEIRRIKIVVSAVKERGIPNELLAEPLAVLEDRLYEADDVVDELDYYRLQQQSQVTLMNRSFGKLRSMVWEYFMVTEKDNGKPVKARCTYCRKEFRCGTKTNGISSMKKHLENEHSVTYTKRPPAHAPNLSGACEPISIGSSSRREGKKRRSKAWDLFDIIEEENGEPIKARCKYCPAEIKCGAKYGTASMLNHNKICKEKPGPPDQPLNPSRTVDASTNATPIVVGDSYSRKRKRVDEESAQITATNTCTPRAMAELSIKIQKITSRLQDIRGDISEVLKLHVSDFPSSSQHHRYRVTTSGQHLRTSSLVTRKVYGRVAEKNSIMKLLMAEDKDSSDSVNILPIVGIAGVGKTTLAQLVYNDPDVEIHFHHRIWVWVSRNFDEVRLTRDMLNFVSQEKHEEINCFVKLQEILKSHVKSKRVFLILDDVWDDMNDCRWNQLFAPFKCDNANGNVILVTTRKPSVAKMIETNRTIKLGPLEDNDFWLLFKSCAFGDRNYEGFGTLTTIGRQIVKKLNGNPLAAITAGALLRNHHSVDHWSNILKKENWKSLRLSAGIMPALKISYDELPHHLQQCLSYCSIFPEKYQFIGEDLVNIWICQGFVNRTQLSKRLEEIGWEYLTDLTNMGFYQKVGIEEVSSFYQSNCQTCYVICSLMYDFLRLISRTECATIDGLQCNEMMSSVRHLSIVTDSAYNKELNGEIPRSEKFEQKLRNAVTSVGKLRTLVLIGQYDNFVFQLFQDIFQNAQSLRLLQMSATSKEINSFMCSLVNTAHLRYLKFKANEKNGHFPQVFSKFFHIQVLDIGSYIDVIVPDGINNLASLRHVVGENRVLFFIPNIGNMTSLQELHEFQVQTASGFEIRQLQSMNELVQLGVFQLDNVETREEAYRAGLRNKKHLEKLHLSWKNTLSETEYVIYTNTISKSLADKGRELLALDDGGLRSTRDLSLISEAESCVDNHEELAAIDKAIQVLEGLEPHMDLKHLHISGYIGTTSPTWLASNTVTALQTLHLDDCGGWRNLPSLESLPFLTKLKLSSMRDVTQVFVPSLLEELVLIKMPSLMICLSTSVKDLSSRLRVLQIEECHALKEFDQFENHDEFEKEPNAWLPCLTKLILCDCPHLKLLKPLPPSATCSELLITGVSVLPGMKGSSSEKLCIGYFDDEYGAKDEHFHKYSDKLGILDVFFLAFLNLGSLKLMTIDGCPNLSSFSFKGFSQIVSLKSLEIRRCRKLFSSDVLPVHTIEDVTAANGKAFPFLESLTIKSCEIAGKWLSLLLRHAPELEELYLEKILSMEEERDTDLAQGGLVHIPLNLISSLKKITIIWCPRLTFIWSQEGFSGFTSIQEVEIWKCPDLLSALMLKDGNDDQANRRWLHPRAHGISGCSQETLQPRFPRNLTSLKMLMVVSDPGLESLQLHSCTPLEELWIGHCELLTAIKGLQSLDSLRILSIINCPGLPPCLESFSRQGYELFPRLEMLHINDPSLLTTSFCECLTSLQHLKLFNLVLTVTEEQGRALLLLTSLQEIDFKKCSDLVDLPAGLHLLPSLKRLKISSCLGISKLPESGLPLSLEELEIGLCSNELADQCRLLATSKLRVKIDGDWLVL